ncbi:hypothetical protein H4R33_000959 [Dimargaris cristalligena]|nr:hypothetical protein H4R33_000959 [Dimargaris cristalligena]
MAPPGWPSSAVPFICQLDYESPDLREAHRLPEPLRAILAPTKIRQLTTWFDSPALCPKGLSLNRPALKVTLKQLARYRFVAQLPPSPNPLVRIRPITQPLSHPACGQCGLFAARRLPPRSLVAVYMGRVTDYDRACPSSDYVLGLDPRDCVNLALALAQAIGQPVTPAPNRRLAIDADARGNEARFVNDYRGIASVPNVEFADFLHESTGFVYMGIWTLADPIQPQAELLINYGKRFWSSRNLLGSTDAI